MKPLSLMDVLVPFVPAPKKQFWASDSGGKFHIETAISNNKAGQEFTALCGVKGDYLHQRSVHQNFMRCEKCLQLSSVTGIDEIESGEGQSDSGDVRGTALQAGDVSSSLTPTASVVGWANGKPPAVIEITDQGKAPQRGIDSLRVGDGSGNCGDLPLGANAAGSMPSGKGLNRPPLSNEQFPDLKSFPVPLGREGVSESMGCAEGNSATERHEKKAVDVWGSEKTVESSGLASYPITSPADSQSLPVHPRSGETGAGVYTSEHPAPEIFKSFSCVRRGIDGFVDAVLFVVDRETAAAEMEHA